MIDLGSHREWPRFTILEQRTATLLLRNCLRHHLRRDFRRMLTRLLIKKTAYKLLASKRKRDVESAFLTVKNAVVRESLGKGWRFRERHTEVRVLGCIYNKL